MGDVKIKELAKSFLNADISADKESISFSFDTKKVDITDTFGQAQEVLDDLAFEMAEEELGFEDEEDELEM